MTALGEGGDLFVVCLVVDQETGMGCVRRVLFQEGIKSCQKRSTRGYSCRLAVVPCLWCSVGQGYS
jgi:hypothetical protein